MEAWRQSEAEGPAISGNLETRLAWAYHRASYAMLTTSLTTCFAFAGCAFSEIWDIRCFGVVNGFMVLANYILIITWFPAAVMVHEQYLKSCMPWCTPTALAFRCCSLVGSGEKEGGDATKEVKKRSNALEDFFAGPFADLIIAHGKKIIAVFLVAIVTTTAVWSTMLVPATKPFSFFDEDHYVQQVTKVQTKKFAYSSLDGQVLVKLAFGVDKKNPWNDGGSRECSRPLPLSSLLIFYVFNGNYNAFSDPTEVYDNWYETTVQSANYVDDFDMFDYQARFLIPALPACCRAAS